MGNNIKTVTLTRDEQNICLIKVNMTQQYLAVIKYFLRIIIR